MIITFVSSVDSLDWKKLPVDEMYKRVTSNVQNGSIVLFHNGVENTPEALDKILTKLKTDGSEFVTVSELIYWDNYEIDHSGRQNTRKTKKAHDWIYQFPKITSIVFHNIHL